MSPNSASNPLLNKLPLSPAERLRLYRQGLRVRRRSYQTFQITITGERIKGLLKRGYISPNEVDDMGAVEQAMNLFVWDELEKLGKRIRETATKSVTLDLRSRPDKIPSSV